MQRASRLVHARQVWLLLGGLLVLALTALAGQTEVLGRFLEPPVWAAIPLAIAAGLIGLVLVALGLPAYVFFRRSGAGRPSEKG